MGTMSNYRRVKIESAWCFFTVVTYKRRSFLTEDTARPILKEAEVGIWQRRFWEHRIRDEDDWNHVHTIHYNPVKHGLVKRLEEWPYSTYHRFCQKGVYDDFDWDLFQVDEYQDKLEFYE